MASKTSPGGIDLSAADLKNLDLSDNDVQRFWAFDFIDDDEEYFGVINDIDLGDLWLINLQVGYATDSFSLYGVHLEDDANNQIWGGHHDEETLNVTMVFTGADLLGGNTPPGNMDLVIQQADTSDSGQNFQVYVSGVRLASSHDGIRTQATGENGQESFD